MKSTAYLLIGVDIHTHQVLSADVFSEDNPTINLGRIRTFVVLQAEGSTYIEAIRKLRRRIYDDVLFEWVIPLIGPRALETFHHASLASVVPVKEGDV